MRAVVIAEQGASPALSELPTLVPGAGEVLVRVEASSLNGFDTAVAAGYLAGMMDRLAADAAAGGLTVPVERTYPLAEVPAAFGDFAGGTLGQLAITLG